MIKMRFSFLLKFTLILDKNINIFFGNTGIFIHIDMWISISKIKHSYLLFKLIRNELILYILAKQTSINLVRVILLVRFCVFLFKTLL